MNEIRSAQDIADILGLLSDLNREYGGLGFTYKNAGPDPVNGNAFKIQVLPNTLASLETPPHQFGEK